MENISKLYWRSDRQIFTDREETLVLEPSDPNAHHLLVGIDGLVPLEKAQALGLVRQETADVVTKVVESESAENKIISVGNADKKKKA